MYVLDLRMHIIAAKIYADKQRRFSALSTECGDGFCNTNTQQESRHGLFAVVVISKTLQKPDCSWAETWKSCAASTLTWSASGRRESRTCSWAQAGKRSMTLQAFYRQSVQQRQKVTAKARFRQPKARSQLACQLPALGGPENVDLCCI